MKKAGTFLILIFLFSPLGLFAQDKSFPEIDSLLSKSARFLDNAPDSALKYSFQSAELSQSKNSSYFLAKSYNAIGKSYRKLDDIDNQITYFQKAETIAAATSDEKLKAQIALNLANAFYIKGNYDEAFSSFRKAQTMGEKLNSQDLLYEAFMGMGDIYAHEEKRNLDSTENYFNKALAIALGEKDTFKIAEAYRILNEVYVGRKQWSEALVYLNKALDLYSKINNINGLGATYKDIGDIYYFTKENKKSIEYYLKSYDLKKKVKNNYEISIGACDLAYMYAMDKRKDLLDKYGDEAYSLAKETKSWSPIKYSAEWLSEAYEKIGDDKKALFYLKVLMSMNDSITNRSRIEKNSREELEGGFEEKVRNIKQEEEKRQAIAEEKAHNQKIIRNILIVGFIVSFILLLLAYNSYVAKKKANVIISKQKKEVETQKIKIEEKNKEITDSINYAKFIQQSILPDPKEIMKIFPNSFGLYKPKAVVSGDFYWFRKNGNIGMIAAADCTGHGVPGALMSMIGIDKLNHATANNITDPGEILSFINAEIKNTLKQNEGTQISQDGMDIALCCFDFSKNSLKYAGANRPLWIIRDGKFIEYKPTKSAIGGYTSTEQKFLTNEIPLQKNDTIYIFSDGYADQFGGGKGKKLMTKNLKELLLSIQNMPILEQEKFLDEKFKSWQGDFEQVDDILVIGIKI